MMTIFKPINENKIKGKVKNVFDDIKKNQKNKKNPKFLEVFS